MFLGGKELTTCRGICGKADKPKRHCAGKVTTCWEASEKKYLETGGALGSGPSTKVGGWETGETSEKKDETTNPISTGGHQKKEKSFGNLRGGKR